MALKSEIQVVKEIRLRGDTWERPIALTDDSGNPYDLTGATIWFTLKESLSDPDPGVIQHSTDDSIVMDDPVTGTAVHTVTATETATLTPGAHYFDYQLVEGDVVTTFAVGRIVVEADATQAVG